MRRKLALGDFEVVEQCACGGDGGGVVFRLHPIGVQILAAKVLRKQGERGVGGELPAIEPRDAGLRGDVFRQPEIIGGEQFGYLQAGEFIGKLVGMDDFGFKFAAFQRSPCQRGLLFQHGKRGDAVGLFVFQQRAVG